MPRDAHGPGIEVVTTPAHQGTEPAVPPSTGRTRPTGTGQPGRARPGRRQPASGLVPGGIGRPGTGAPRPDRSRRPRGSPKTTRPGAGRHEAGDGARRPGPVRCALGRAPCGTPRSGAPRRGRPASPRQPGPDCPAHRAGPGPPRCQQPRTGRRALVPARACRRGPAVQCRSRRPRAAAARATVAAGVRSPGSRARPGACPGRGGHAFRRRRAVHPAAGHRPALPVARTGPVLAHPAHRVRRPSQPGEASTSGWPPRTWTRRCRGRRWVMGRCGGCRHRAAAGRAEGGQRGTAAVPRPGHHRHRRHRAGAGRPGRRAGADLGHRPGADGHRRAVRDGRGAGHQPLVGPDAADPGRLRPGPGRYRAGPGRGSGLAGRGAARDGGPGRRGRRGHGGRRYRAGRGPAPDPAAGRRTT